VADFIAKKYKHGGLWQLIWQQIRFSQEMALPHRARNWPRINADDTDERPALSPWSGV